jgi:hypothetical protein
MLRTFSFKIDIRMSGSIRLIIDFVCDVDGKDWIYYGRFLWSGV